MDYLKILQQLRQSIPDSLVHIGCAQTSADDHDHGLVGGEAAHIQSGQFTALCQFCTNGGTGEDGLVCRDIFHGFREITAHFFRYGNAQLVGQSRCHIRFVDDTGNM